MDLVKKLEAIMREHLEIQVRPNDPKDVPGISAESITVAAEAIAALQVGGEREEMAAKFDEWAKLDGVWYANVGRKTASEMCAAFIKAAALLRAPVAVTDTMVERAKAHCLLRGHGNVLRDQDWRAILSAALAGEVG